MKTALFVIDRPLRDNDRGIVSTIDQLSKKYQVVVVGLGKECDMDGVIFYDFTFGVSFKYLKKILCSHLFLFPVILLLYLCIKYKPAVIYLREIRYLIPVFLANKFYKNCKYILDIRENPRTNYSELKFFLKKFGKFCDRTITNSPKLKDELIYEYEMPSVEVQYALPAQSFLKKINLGLYKHDGKKIRLCFFGDVKPDRKLEMMVEAVNLLKHIPVVFDIYGRIPVEDYGRQLKKMDLYDRVTLHGLIDYKSAPEKLVTYDCGILINEINENSSNTIPGKLWEYISCGLCIISNNRPTVTGFINDYNLGLIGDTPQELANAIEYLYHNKDKLLLFRDNSRIFFNQIYTQ